MALLYASGIVGGSDRLSTWGKFRVLMAKNARDMPVRTMYNREWDSGLKLTGAASGWIRKPPTDRGSTGGFDLFSSSDWQPLFLASTYSPPPPDPDVGQVEFLPLQWFRPTVSAELQEYLSGIVYTDGGNIAMGLSFWANSGGLVASPATTVDSVDGLTDI